MSSSRHVVILDPGLSELGGHHAAAIDALLSSEYLKGEKITLEVFINKACRADVFRHLNRDSVTLIPHFETSYYQYFYQQESLQQLQGYLRGLAKEYFSALSISLERNFEKPVLFWCHTLGWHHAYALALALDLLAQRSRAAPADFVVVVGLMYGFSFAENSFQAQMSFRYLARQRGVHFYAADLELQQSYHDLLDCAVDLQPCLLLADKAAGKNISIYTDKKKNKQSSTQIILYAGDAKDSKGFLLLPELVLQVVKAFKQLQFIVQFTINNSNQHLLDAEKSLLRLGVENNNLTVINDFIDHQSMMNLFDLSDVIVFNHSEEIYKHQSSGLFWLSAFYNMSIINMTDTWITREARRMGVGLIQGGGKKNNIVELISISLLQVNSVALTQSEVSVSESYCKQIFQDVGKWLVSQFDSLLPSKANIR